MFGITLESQFVVLLIRCWLKLSRFYCVVSLSLPADKLLLGPFWPLRMCDISTLFIQSFALFWLYVRLLLSTKKSPTYTHQELFAIHLFSKKKNKEKSKKKMIFRLSDHIEAE